MKKRGLLLGAGLALCLILGACSAESGGTADMSGGEAAPMAGGAESYQDTEGLSPGAQPREPGGNSVYRSENAKIIRTAWLELETTDFGQARDTLGRLVEQLDGYFESAETGGGDYYDQGASMGSFVIRVSAERYAAFLNSVGDVGYVSSTRESTQDIGSEYFDTEAHLKTLRIKQERLQSLLEKAPTMEDIIDLEDALADVEYEIEQNSSQLRRYDGLVDYATINLTLSQVRRISEPAGEEAGLGTRLAAAFSGGMGRFGDGLGNFVVWCAYHFMGICLVLIAAAGLVFVLRRKRAAREAALSAPAVDPGKKERETPPEG